MKPQIGNPKERTLTQEIAWRLADVYAAQTHGNYDEETLFERGGDWAADEVGEVLSEHLGFPTEALEAGVVRELVEALEALVGEIEWEIGEEKWGRDPDTLPMARAVLAKARFVEARPEDLDYIERFNPETVLALLDHIEALEQERDAARAEAERWKQQYEELRAGVERVVQHLYERTRATSRDWCQSRHPYHDGASDAYCEAFLKVRRVLGEAGGGDFG